MCRAAFCRSAVAQRFRRAADLKIVPARICALAAIAAAPVGLRRKKTQAAVRIAERAVNEDFSLYARRRRDVRDFFQRQFARKHYPREAHRLQRFRARAIVHGQLRARVQFKFRKMFADNLISAQILNDQGIDANLAHCAQRVDQLVQFVLKNQRIYGDEHAPFAFELMSERGDRIKIVELKILSFGARRKLLQAQINRIRAVVKRRITPSQDRPRERAARPHVAAPRLPRAECSAELRSCADRIRPGAHRSSRRGFGGIDGDMRQHGREREAVPRGRTFEAVGGAAGGFCLN